MPRMQAKRIETMMEVTNVHEPSRLESFPGELLNRIYRYAVVQEGLTEPAVLIFDAWAFKTESVWRTNEPALARTCKRFRKDVLPIYYSENVFNFWKLHHGNSTFIHPPPWSRRMQPWINSVSQNVSDIRHVVGRSWYYARRVGKWSHLKIVVTISEDTKQVDLSLLEEDVDPATELFQDTRRRCLTQRVIL